MVRWDLVIGAIVSECPVGADRIGQPAPIWRAPDAHKERDAHAYAHADPSGQLLTQRYGTLLTDTGRSRLLYAAIDARSFPLRLRGAEVCFAIHDVTLSIVSDRGARPFLMR